MKRVILGLAALVLSAATCQAGSVQATFTGLQVSVSDGSGNGGVFNWSGASYTNPKGIALVNFTGGNSLGSFQTFCIETNQNIGNSTYIYQLPASTNPTDLTAALAAAPTAKSGGMGSAAATNLQLLFGQFGPTTFNSSGVDLGAMQLAIWTIVDGSLTLSSTLVGANGGPSATVVIDAQNYLTYVQNNQSGPLANYLVALTNQDNQDQLGIISPPGGPGGPHAPEPASMTLLGIGIAGMAGFGWRRRKQAKATA